MNTLSIRLSALRSWFAKPRYVWIALAVVVLALGVTFRPGTSEPTIRLVGLALQLMGICTVIWGISETRNLFGHPSLSSKVKAWLGEFPLRRRSIVIGAAAIAAGSASVKGRGYVTHGPGPNPTTETRLNALEKNIAALHDRISGTEREMDAELQKGADALKGEADARLAEDKTIREKLEATGTGGVHISAIGAFWLFVGVTLSTASVELAAIFK
jgi:hypothetical protein